MMFSKTAVMFTAFNDGETIGDLIKKVIEITKEKSDIWVINDGSKDNTSKIAKKLDCCLVDLPENQGVGSAYKAGFSEIIKKGEKYKYVIKIDADGQHQPKFIPKIIRNLENGFQLVVCSRFHERSCQNSTPKDRSFLNWLYARELSQIIGSRVTDARSGFFGITLPVLKKITPKLITPGYGIPMEVLLRTWQFIKEVKKWPNSWREEIIHPAIYDYAIHKNTRRHKMYQSEEWHHKIERFLTAYTALVTVLYDMGFNTHEITQRISKQLAEHTEYLIG
ncbi:MAG: glycosyltransferase family 2 protein [Patescibacteria group bacterium]|nr:glycosyltransferase family 2 protein [Patescibacteria group bacterium]